MTVSDVVGSHATEHCISFLLSPISHLIFYMFICHILFLKVLDIAGLVTSSFSYHKSFH